MKFPQTLSLRYKALVSLLVAVVASVFALSAQQEQNNIYLFDCTGSMKKLGLWVPAKNALHTTITNQSSIPEARFTVVTFGDEPCQTFSFTGPDYPKTDGKIQEAQEDGLKKARYTNICGALEKAFSLCEPAKENKIYLLTDGEPNRGGGPAEVAALIDRWCADHKNTRLFYVALSPEAVNPVIEDAIKRCRDAYIVKCQNNLIPQIADISPSDIHANIEELSQEHILRFSIPGDYPVKVISSDPLFDVEVIGGKAVDRKIRLRVKARNGESAAELHSLLAPLVDAGHIYRFPIVISAGCSDFFIANPAVTVNMADRIQSKLTLLGGDTEEVRLDEARWYGSFLWSDALPDGEVNVDLAPKFTNVDAGASMRFSLVETDDAGRDFRVYFNDREVPQDASFEITPGAPARLRIIFDNDAREGKRYFSLLNRGGSGIDILNGVPASDVEGLPLRARYCVNWNPLKTALTIAAIVIVGTLLLWLLVLKFIFIPVIKASRVEILGPGSYYVPKKIKGVRKVIMTSRRENQGLLSRIFTGKILYIRADHFTPPIEILPASGKKIRLRSLPAGKGSAGAGWDFSPSAIISPYEKTTVIPRSGDAAGKFSVECQ